MNRTLTTEATASKTAVPEHATVEVKVVGEGDSATRARDIARDRAATVRTSLREAALDSTQIRTVELRVEDEMTMFGGEDSEPYQAVERLRADCLPETVEELVVAATDAGGSVPNVEFHLREKVRQQSQEDALADALNRAREKAERMAATHGLALESVQSVTTVDDDAGMSSIVDEAFASTEDADLSPAPITVSESVEVVYELCDE